MPPEHTEVPESPYPGLRPFEAHETHLFFGREQQVDAVLERLHDSRLVAIVGESGAGKSSLLRAGLLPALEAGFFAEAGSNWCFVVMRPGGAPFTALCGALLAPGVLSEGGMQPAPGYAAAELRRGPLGLVQLVKDARLPAHTNLLIAVDQFEELFRYGSARNRDEAEAFVELLLRSVRQREHAIYVVLTMRSDFIGECARMRGLPEALNDHQFLTPRLTREQIGLAVRGPARVCGGDVEDVLVSELANEAGDDPDQLPLLQHLLMRMWAHAARSGGAVRLTLAQYRKLGGLRAALDQHAEELFASLNPPAQRLTEGLFKCITGGREGRRDVRRPAPFAAVMAATGGTAGQLGEVIEVFRGPGRHFLMPPTGVALQPETQIDISHESLIRQWQRLQQWVRDEAASVADYVSLRKEALNWKRDEGELIMGRDLLRALDWRERARPTKGWAARYGSPESFDATIEYITASEREERRQRDARQVALEREASMARRLRWWSRGLGLAMFAASVAAAYGWRSSTVASEALKGQNEALAKAEISLDNARKAEAAAQEERKKAQKAEEIAKNLNLDLEVQREMVEGERDKALAATDAALVAQKRVGYQKLGFEAMLALNTDPQEALKKARDSVLGDPANAQADMVLRRAVSMAYAVRPIEGVPRSKHYASGDGGTYLTFGLGIRGSRNFHPSGDRVVVPLVTDAAKGAQIIHTRTGRILRLVGHKDTVGTATFSPDGRWVATSSADRTARVWDAASGRLLFTLAHAATVNSVVFDTSGERLVTASDHSGGSAGQVSVWNLRGETGRPLLSMPQTKGDAIAAVFSPDGKHIVSMGFGADAVVWDAATGTRLHPLALRDGKRRSYGPSNCLNYVQDVKWSIDYSPDGRWLAALDSEGRTTLFDAATFAPQPEPLQLPADERLCAIAWSGDSLRLAGASQDGSVKVWMIKDPKNPVTVPSGNRRSMVSMAFHPKNSSLLLTASSNKIARLWGVDEDRRAIQIMTLRGHDEVVGSAQFSPDGRYILTAADDGTARLWTLPDDSHTRPLTNRDGIDLRSKPKPAAAQAPTERKEAEGCDILARSPDGQTVARVCKDKHGGQVVSLGRVAPDTSKGRELESFGISTFVSQATFSPQGELLAMAIDQNGNMLARVFDLKTWRAVAEMSGQSLDIAGLAFDPTGRFLATRGNDRAFYVWDSTSGTQLAVVQTREVPRGLRFGADGRTVIVEMGNSVESWHCRFCGSTDAVLAEAARIIGSPAAENGTRPATTVAVPAR